MRRFDYHRPQGADEAVGLVSGDPEAVYLAGGTNLVDHLRLGVARPGTLVDVAALGMDTVEEYDGGLRIGANVSNSDVAADPRVRHRFPVLSRALLAGASAQVRNQASTAGNLLQRTRCVYFQDVTTPCNKRAPGSGCAALAGYGRQNAVLGASRDCVAVHPGDMPVALAALDAVVVVHGTSGERRVPIGELHRLPGDRPEQDTTLEHGELITAVEVPDLPAGARSTYQKARERASYAFALASVAVVVRMEERVLAEVRLAWGGVAHKPWRARIAEQALTGAVPTHDRLRAALDAELAHAVPGHDNAFKVPLTRNLSELVLARLVGGGSR